MSILIKVPPVKSWKASIFLRVVVAIVFALIAFIFSELVPDIPPLSHTFLRVIITLFFAILGYSLFPDLARIITINILSGINYVVSRVVNEVMNQILRLPQNNTFNASFPSHGPVGGVSISQPLIMDTSAIIDGRILDIAKTSFLFGTLLLPTFVLQELQQVADSADFIKRSRGRRGFEIIEDLKKIKGIRVEVWDKDVSAKAVDDKLIKLAKNLHGKIITTDFNLNRVATLSSVTVLNINELANAVKTVAVPGEQMTVKVVHLGKDSKQGVGYLPDGTMIVVENGAELVGKDVKTEVTRLIQVAAGRMIFVKKI